MSTCPDNQAVHDAIARGMNDFSMIYIILKYENKIKYLIIISIRLGR